MKAKELIEKLTKIVEEHGDLEILVEEKGFGGYSVSTMYIKEEIDELYFSDLGENGYPTIDTVKKLFNKIEIETEDDLYELEELNEDYTCKHITIVSGENLYTT